MIITEKGGRREGYIYIKMKTVYYLFSHITINMVKEYYKNGLNSYGLYFLKMLLLALKVFYSLFN